ncbi:porin [Paraburkholderia sp. CNPSo 3155]|uniref:Putative porin n=1 Tax=Paraburkholderia atlantica TaxID=2654982 RepID=A0A6I1Q2C7_PARAM|nr:porin [Paraburkholderia atlantica]MBB5423142.1 putative porin [Paraburkholderia atlantica]MPW08654.1 porin [Paraburkholderia atlantica]
MKRLACLAALTTLGIGSAYAQSTVTLYGRIAGGLDYVTNVATPEGSKNNLRFGSNQYGYSWFGLKGDEDLGAGLHVVFKLESLFTSGTGEIPPDTIFTRDAYVGLASDKLGSVWFGRAMSLTDETGWYIDPFGEQATGIGNFAFGRAWGPRSNVVTYNSPNWSGLSFRVQNGFGGQAGNFPANRQFSTSAQYTLANLAVYGVYEEIRDANGKFSDLYSASREYMAGVTYQLSAVKFYTGYQALVSSGADTVATTFNPYAATRSEQVWLGASYQATPALAFQAGWFHGNVNHGGGTGNLGVLGTTYNLSKRTFMYLTVGAMFNGKNAAFPVETAESQPLPGHNQQGGYFGIMHYF